MFPTRELINSLETHVPLDSETLASVVDALSGCEEAVTACAAGMLGEDDVDRLRRSVLHDLDCGDALVATRRLLTRATGDDYGLIAAQLEVCLIACERSNETCSRTAGVHEHCRLCTVATRRAADACRSALDALRT
jgi:hypothetical protein